MTGIIYKQNVYHYMYSIFTIMPITLAHKSLHKESHHIIIHKECIQCYYNAIVMKASNTNTLHSVNTATGVNGK